MCLSLFYFLFYSFFRPRVLCLSISRLPSLLTDVLAHSFTHSFAYSRRRSHSFHLWLCDLLQNRNSQYFNQANSTTNKNNERLLGLNTELCDSVCSEREQKILRIQNRIQTRIHTKPHTHTHYRVKWSTDLFSTSSAARCIDLLLLKIHTLLSFKPKLEHDETKNCYSIRLKWYIMSKNKKLLVDSWNWFFFGQFFYSICMSYKLLVVVGGTKIDRTACVLFFYVLRTFNSIWCCTPCNWILFRAISISVSVSKWVIFPYDYFLIQNYHLNCQEDFFFPFNILLWKYRDHT